MKSIVIALSLFGMAYSLPTLKLSDSLGGLGGYGGDSHGYDMSYDDGSYKGDLSLGGHDDGSYKGDLISYGNDDGSYKSYGDDGSYKGGYGDGGYGGDNHGKVIMIKKSYGGYDGGYGGGYGGDNHGKVVLVQKSYGGYDGGYDGGDMDMGMGGSHGHFAPMPRQKIQLVGVPVPVHKPYPVAVDKPYTVKIDKPYPVKIEKVIKKPYIAKVERPVIDKTIHVQTHKTVSYGHH